MLIRQVDERHRGRDEMADFLADLSAGCRDQAVANTTDFGERQRNRISSDDTSSESTRFGRNRALHYDLDLIGLLLF